jgi:hypothetical protein
MAAKAEHYNSEIVSDRSPSEEENAVTVGEAVPAYGSMPPDPDEGKSPEEKAAIDKALLRKLDLKLIPWLSLLYLISFLDRKYNRRPLDVRSRGNQRPDLFTQEQT